MVFLQMRVNNDRIFFKNSYTKHDKQFWVEK